MKKMNNVNKITPLNLATLNPATKIILLLFVIVLFYFSLFSLVKPLFITQPTSMMQMMGQITGSDMLNFSGSSFTMNVIALMGALLIGIVMSFYLFQSKNVDTTNVDTANGNTEAAKRDYAILRKALSPDEQAILDEIEKAGEITQDSLRFRLDWSKAKVSTILTNLDRMNLIQRERVGKTYNVYFTVSDTERKRTGKERFKTV